MKWTDVRDVAFALIESHPGVEPLTLSFTQLHAWVLALPGFEGKPDESNEKILEAIQMAWLDEAQD
jgi:FeS assembly protein IscX